jgi:aminoglycoside phosphotransferase (APT) family kinase protein
MRIVRYKPERRFIAEVRACFEDEEKGTHFKERLFLRYFPDSRGEHLLAINRQIRESGGQHLVPVGLAARMEGRLYVECLVPGRQALQCLEEGLAIDGRRLARALYEFHQCSVPMLEARTVADEVARSLEQLRVLGCADRDVADAVEAVADRLTAFCWGPLRNVTLHGDFHLKQIMIDSESIALVDLERCAKGDARIDLGFFVAQLDALAEERTEFGTALADLKNSFLHAYEEMSGKDSLRELHAYSAVATLELAILPFRRMEAEWPRKVLAHLMRALSLLPPKSDGWADSRFVSHPRPDPIRSLGLSAIYPTSQEEWPTRRDDKNGDAIYGLFDPRTGAHRFLPLDNDAVAAPPWPQLEDLKLLSRRVHARAAFEASFKGERVIAKALPWKKARRARERLTLAHHLAMSSGGSIRVPRLLETSEETHILILERIDLPALHEGIREGSIPDRQIQHLARALSSWHKAMMSGSNPSGGVPIATSLHALYTRVAPFLRTQREVIAEYLAAVPADFVPTGRSPVHGDLHDKNILLSDREIALIDWDGLHPGAPEEDVGNLLAHFYLRGLQHGHGRSFAEHLRDVFLHAYGSYDSHLETLIEWTTILRLVMLYHLRRCPDAVLIGLIECLQQRLPKEWKSP